MDNYFQICGPTRFTSALLKHLDTALKSTSASQLNPFLQKRTKNQKNNLIPENTCLMTGSELLL